MSLLQNSNAIPVTASADFYDHQIANSCRFDGTAHMSDTRGSDGSTTTGTISFWFKRSGLSSYTYLLDALEDGNNAVRITILADDTIEFRGETGGAVKFELETTQVFRDPSAWVHFVGIIDMTNGTQGDRVKMYINGERVTAFDTETYPADASQTMVLNTSGTLRLGNNSEANYDFDGYLAEVVVIDGTAQAITDMGTSKNGVWIPADSSSRNFGTNGVYLKYESSGDLGNDSSGNNHDFSLTNISAHDQMLDTPTFNSSSNGGNFCTMNPLNSGSNNTFSEGNLKVTNSSGGCTALGTMSLVTGHKWYFEGKVTGSGNNWIGIIEENGYTNSANTNSSIAGSAGFNNYLYAYNGSIYYGANSSATGATITTGDIIGVLVDLESATNTIQFYKNGAAQGSAFNLTGTGINYTPMSDRGSSTGNGFWFNFGQEGSFGTGSGGGNSDVNGYGSFYYDDGASAKAICTGNLPIAEEIDPAKTDDNYPQKLFNAVAYTGNGSSGRTLSIGMAKKPSISMNKRRSGDTVAINVWSAAYNSGDYDSFGELHSDADWYANQGVNGPFSAAPTASTLTYTAYGQVNASSAPYVSWNFVANGGSTSSNTNGSITSTVEVDPSGCFSVGNYTGNATNSTIGHGLSKVPSFILIKKMTGQDRNWICWHTSLSNTQGYFYLNTNSAAGTDSLWNNTAPTSSVFSVNNGTTEVNAASGHTYLFWAFANCDWIKAGKYIGNAADDGAYVHTGFDVAWLFLRAVDSGDDPQIYDNARDTYNPATKVIPTHSTAAETDNSNRSVDFLSNGFKFRDSNSNINGSDSDGYLYLAIGHNPAKYSTAK